jgi:hypothetical protein
VNSIHRPHRNGDRLQGSREYRPYHFNELRMLQAKAAASRTLLQRAQSALASG